MGIRVRAERGELAQLAGGFGRGSPAGMAALGGGDLPVPVICCKENNASTLCMDCGWISLFLRGFCVKLR